MRLSAKKNYSCGVRLSATTCRERTVAVHWPYRLICANVVGPRNFVAMWKNNETHLLWLDISLPEKKAKKTG